VLSRLLVHNKRGKNMKTEQLTKLFRIIYYTYVAFILASTFATWKYPEHTDYFGPGLVVFAVLIIVLGALLDRIKGTKIDLQRKIVYIIALISLVFVFASRLVPSKYAESFGYVSAGLGVFVVLLAVAGALMMRNKATKIDPQQKIVYIMFTVSLAFIFASTFAAWKYPDHDYGTAGLTVFMVLLLVLALMARRKATRPS